MKKPRPNYAKRTRHKSRMSQQNTCDSRNRMIVAFATLARRYVERQRPTEITIVLRLINILGLALFVMVVAFLGSDEHIKEIVNLGKELFHLLP